MIREITINNIALIDNLTISFDEGFNVLTGETGAGKSIIIDSVNLALGERADRELIQTGKDCARVEVLFHLQNPEQVNHILAGYGIEPEEDGSLLLMRELTRQGKNICRINGRSVTLSMLREVSKHLVDVHGQHQHQSLLSAESHINFLDRLGGSELESRKADLKQAWNQWRSVKREIDKILGLNKDGERRKDILKYQIDEISKANLQTGEEEELRKERAILIHSEKIMSTVNDSYQELYSGAGTSSSISDRLAMVISQMQTIQNIDEPLDSIISQLESIQYSLEDSILSLRSYKDQFEFDPLRLENIEIRIDEIQSIKRKYGNTVEEVLKLKDEMEAELDMLENSQEKLESLQRESQLLYQDVLAKCRQVSCIRKEKAKYLEQELIKHLTDLNMDKTRFKVSITTPDLNSIEDSSKANISENGFDLVEFLISPNPGEPLKPLAKIISGGEMSRIMLAFKSILGHMDEIPTMIFDEIDVGISGRTAASVAKKIGAISRSRQVICVTHLPQIASMADGHYVIEKNTLGSHTSTTVSKLSAEKRKEEVARMIGGSSVTQLSLDHASELISSAAKYKGK
jgi:DNA repair protein RecN (Recombination protein N)